ncbi:uncharacterized protein LOC125533249 [Triticum urartu]|uniref:uncharacterized protein LOC125533249 n=1 Tax=Triticum urartu TaxID=4572 RepID=UPI002044CAC2|nr:uncharacterized protein LOC125533249 [Triticum urartu]
MQQLALDFYKNLYTSEGVQGMQEVLDHVPVKVTAAMNASLLAPYEEKEVKAALFQMFPTKAPGPDGFPAHFFQRHWDVCGEAVTRAVLGIVRGEESPEGLNDTLLVLIPKRNRSKANSYCALKLDMMKAYDRVEWTYLRAIMEKLGFASQWTARFLKKKNPSRPCSASGDASSTTSSPLHIQPLLPHPISTARLISAAAPNATFAVEDYLVSTCGLTRAHALKASAKLPHLKSPSNPDTVLAFLAGIGLSGADVATAVARDPRLLCAKLDKALASNVAGLAGLGLSRCEIARIVSLAGYSLGNKSAVAKLQYYLPLFASPDKFIQAMKFNTNLLTYSLEGVTKLNVAFLHKCGLGACDMLTINIERLRAMVACAEGLGVPHGSRMFWRALNAAASLREESIAAKVDSLKNIFRWSGAEVGIAFCKAPMVLALSKDLLQSKSDFLISDVGLSPAYIAPRSTLLTFSLEEKVFMEKFICPHKEAAPQLSEDYAVACKGEVPTRFRFS